MEVVAVLLPASPQTPMSVRISPKVHQMPFRPTVSCERAVSGKAEFECHVEWNRRN